LRTEREPVTTGIPEMAVEKDKRAKRRKDGARKQRPATAPQRAERQHLRDRTEPRRERRYEPKTSLATTASAVGMSVGAVLAGAGTWAQWFRPEDLGPHKYAPWLLGAAALSLFVVAIFGRWGARAVRIGDAGVALEKDGGELERIGWYEVTGFVQTPEMITVKAAGTSIGVPTRSQPQAAARLVAEAIARLPERARALSAEGLPALDDGAGEDLPLEAPQIAGRRCRRSDKLIAFERDARLCGRCGEIYHSASIPKRCVTCDAALRA
jgi:hypothetical protein